MYVPPMDSLLRALGSDRQTLEREGQVTIPKELFKLLIQTALEHSEFNEVGYLRDNPDVAEAVRDGEIEDAREHYIGYGYFEGRTGGTPAVDEGWYLTTYVDVAQAVKSGSVRSASEHYNAMGGTEGRSPNATYLPVAAKWKRALTATR